jgi:hypothetical protein
MVRSMFNVEYVDGSKSGPYLFEGPERLKVEGAHVGLRLVAVLGRQRSTRLLIVRSKPDNMCGTPLKLKLKYNMSDKLGSWLTPPDARCRNAIQHCRKNLKPRTRTHEGLWEGEGLSTYPLSSHGELTGVGT